MVFLDNTLDTMRAPARLRLPEVTLAAIIGLAALAVALVCFAVRDFSDNGLRFATQTVWRFECFIFFAALVAGPLGRLVGPLRFLAAQSRPLLQGFCAGIAVYLATIIVPNLVVMPDGVRHYGITSGMMIFVLFTGGVTLVMGAAVNQALCARVGRPACRAMLGLSAIYFWLCFGLIGLSHISGPHRPDVFYGLSINLMVLGLLARFADRFAAAPQSRLAEG